MVKRRTAAVLPINLPHLQHLVKKDPKSYRDEFLQQWNHYETVREIFLIQPSNDVTEFSSLVDFIAQTCNHYTDITKDFSKELMDLLQKNHDQFPFELSEKIVQALVLLKNKSALSPITLLQCFFPLFSSNPSRAFRELLYEQVSLTVRNANKKAKNDKLNKAVQAALFTLVETSDTASITHTDYSNKKHEYSPNELSGMWAVKMVQDLWKRNIWSGDARAVNIMKTAALSNNTKVMLSGIYFFLGADTQENEEEEEEEDDGLDVSKLMHQSNINKKTKSREAQILRIRALVKKKERGKMAPPANVNFPALQLLYDPQGFAEELFEKQLVNSNRSLSMDHKLVVLRLLTRLIGTHKLTVLGLYSYMMKYLTPHQREVTQFLACLAQASHEFIPPDVLEPLIRKIADEFVTTGVANEVVCAGINAIREVCARCPFAMTADLLQDLTEYKSSKDKGVMMASRGLITLYREVAPDMLKKKDRGKLASMELKDRAPIKFGEELNVVHGIEGLELLEKYKNENEDGGNEDDDSKWENWEAVDNESDSGESEGWVNLGSDDDINISDSEGENNNQKDTGGTSEDKAKLEDSEHKNEASNLAARSILTPADLKKLEELREKANVDRLVHGPKRVHAGDAVVDAGDIEGPKKRMKDDREGRLARVMEGREGREKFGSKSNQFNPTSLSNKRKQKNKNFMMIKHKVKGKAGRSLMQKRKSLRDHIDREKKRIK
ncbi:SDA1 family protein [Schizosaccharomyces cryophilus OY26]|uniref:Protein SDA1 n=1 Tax=Schizosaccharomyces cryophilus (strain OY26 / ATCC MYA-4695 / CBS 11777 / NBRC 106824 / NRRL Y48691) TaxID=653667 RepID=S9VT77_SCHCR|nr:SDA1 family protein [Schizosaccharomyces cryophilus OY26]EPY51078.1 SDA1 family protein [Schizosaccharomyces cryophilus OY26]